MGDTDRLAALLEQGWFAGANDAMPDPWHDLAARLIAAGVTLDPQPDVKRLAFAIAAAEGGDGWTPWSSEYTNAELIAEKYGGIDVHTHHPECGFCNPSLLDPRPDNPATVDDWVGPETPRLRRVSDPDPAIIPTYVHDPEGPYVLGYSPAAAGVTLDPVLRRHPFTCGLCSWGRDGAYHDKPEYDNHMAHVHPDEWAGVTLDPRPAPDAALREAAEDVLAYLDTAAEWQTVVPDGRVAALRAALEAER